MAFHDAGNPEGAFALLTQAAGGTVTGDDREAVYGSIGALVADADSALSVPALVSSPKATAAGPNRAWAVRSLSVAYSVTERAADSVAATLVAAQAGTDHATSAHGVCLAVEADDLARSLDRLEELSATVAATDTFSVETYASPLAPVAASFLNADLSAATGGVGRDVAGRSGGSGTPAEASARGREAFADEVAVYPNPPAGRYSVRVLLAEASASTAESVYVAPGLRVAILHDGPLAAGPHEVPFGMAALAPGVHVVHVRVSPMRGGAWTEVCRGAVVR